MNFIKFFLGWIWYNIKAGFWYMGLVFRLWFAIGLDRNFDHKDDDEKVVSQFRYPGKREYRRHLGRQAE